MKRKEKSIFDTSTGLFDEDERGERHKIMIVY